MQKRKILIADDEERILIMYKKYLTKQGFDVVCAKDGDEAVRLFFELKDVDLVILDVMMPKKDGYTACKEIKENSSVPVIFLTAKDTDDDHLQGLQYGAEDYITKSTKLELVLKKIEIVMERFNLLNTNIIEDDGIVIDTEKHTVHVDGELTDICLKEFDLLLFMIKNKGKALSRETLLKNVWDYDYFEDSRTLDTHIKKVRKKIGTHKDNIKTVWGVGYKYDSTPESIA